jgi:hypothetical protein
LAESAFVENKEGNLSSINKQQMFGEMLAYEAVHISMLTAASFAYFIFTWFAHILHGGARNSWNLKFRYCVHRVRH